MLAALTVGRVADPDPHYTKLLDPDPDPEGQKLPTKKENFMF
jgi:hypothetical protein